MHWPFTGLAVRISLRFDTDVMMKPDFLIIGAQKCATSWLHFHLSQHPQIMLPAEKDVEFFSYPVNLNPETSRAWLERFDDASGEMRVGDVNGAYFWTETGSEWGVKDESFNKQIPGSVRDFLGEDLQLIISLRNPVERAVSAYLHHVHHGVVALEQGLLEIKAPLGIVDMGFYAAHLKNWLDAYPARRFLVIRELPFDRTSASNLLAGTLAFLGLADFQEDKPFETPIYAGIPRIIRPDGVWVPREHPSIAGHLPLARRAPGMVLDDTRYICLVDGDELSRLKHIFEQDQAMLNDLLTHPDITVLEP